MVGRLTEAGIEVIFGIPGLKVHSKLFLIERMEEGQVVRYSHVGTETSTKRPRDSIQTLPF